MSKWMNRLQEEMGKNKSASSQPLSVLSVPFRGLLEKNNEVWESKIESQCFQPMSVLSVPDSGVSVKFYNIKNIRKDAYMPADNTDIGSFVDENTQSIDFPISFGADVKGNIKNITDNPHTPTDNTDIGSFAGVKNQHIDFSDSFADAIEMTRTRGKPKQIRETKWGAIVRRLDVLADEENRHLLKMIEYGWSVRDIFGCHKFAPEMRFDSMGLLMLLTNSGIAEVHPEKALLKTRSGQTMSYYLGTMNRNLSERSTLMEIE